jgi:hypothetical protein
MIDSAMIDSVRPATTAPLPCKICGGMSTLFGVLDFNNCCLEHQGIREPLSGVPIYYRRCGNCGFLFTDALDDWSEAQFKSNIYNDKYLTFDPDYQSSRPLGNAQMVMQLWGQHRAKLRVLDFGGGNDVFSAALRAGGFAEAVTYDPMVAEYARRPEGKFDVVTCFETLEHLPDPLAAVAHILEFLAEPGLVCFTTLLQPADLINQGLNWWYAAPRNGHISLFSRDALALTWSRHGYKLMSSKDHLHFAYRTLPPYARVPGT